MRFLETFPDNIATAIGADKTDKGFGNIEIRQPVELKVMDCAKNIDFPDNSFDLVFSKDMFECITDKVLFVKELHRILKPGREVICVNCDWDSVVYNGYNKELLTKAVHAYAECKQPWMDDLDSWIGRRMYGIFNSTGLFQSSVTIHTVIETECREGFFGYDFSGHIGWLVEQKTGYLKRKEYDVFLCDLKKAYSNGDYLFSKPYYIYKGLKIAK